MSCEIIQFSAAARTTRKAPRKPTAAKFTASCDDREERRPLEPPLTETCKNSRLRLTRRDAWWRAERVTDYWRARLDWHSALEIAHLHEIADSASLPLPGKESRFDLVDKWREAVVKQLLTPAPDGAAVTWKRAQLAGRRFSQLPTKQSGLNEQSPMTSRSSTHIRREPSGAPHEAPAPIGQEAQPAADCRARKAAEAMKGFLTIPE
jgi:hypothetical protein